MIPAATILRNSGMHEPHSVPQPSVRWMCSSAPAPPVDEEEIAVTIAFSEAGVRANQCCQRRGNLFILLEPDPLLVPITFMPSLSAVHTVPSN